MLRSTKQLTILSPLTDNSLPWISVRERMVVEKISRPISMKERCQTRASVPRPSDYQSAMHSTELKGLAPQFCKILSQFKTWHVSSFTSIKQSVTNMLLTFYISSSEFHIGSVKFIKPDNTLFNSYWLMLQNFHLSQFNFSKWTPHQIQYTRGMGTPEGKQVI